MRNIPRKILAAAIAGSAVVAGFAMPANAQTDATFEVTGGDLAIVEPASTVDLGTVAAGDLTLTADLGDVTVNDDRGVLVAEWTATVSSTDFASGADAAQIVTNDNIAYTSGAGLAADVLEVGVFAPGAGALGAGITAGSWAGTGVNHVTWNPTLVFTLQMEQVAGIYAGTITHSVA